MSTPYLAEIRIFSFNFPPKGWAACNGQLLPISQYTAVFALVGTSYGGNGTTNFALPNLQGRVPVHTGNGFVLGESAGEAAHTLTTLELPAHTHVPVASSDAANVGNPAGSRWAQGNSAYNPVANATMNSACVATAGGGQPHENRPPFLVLNFCIALTGIFPSRS